MNILFIGYWAYDEGLTQSTILPHLKILTEMQQVKKVVFTSIERSKQIKKKTLESDKVLHIPLSSKNLPVNLFNKFYDFLYFPKQLIGICQKYSIDHIICRGAPAGSLGYLVSKKTEISFSVESFEPHASYMLESGTWKNWDPRYIMQKHWEEQQKKHAFMLFPVANNYKKQLVNEKVEEGKIFTQPCEVDLEKFSIDTSRKIVTRANLLIGQDSIVGIYVGKFGNIYWDQEAFSLFNKARHYFGNRFHLLILSQMERQLITASLSSVKFPKSQYTLIKASFEQVPAYINCTDFAFALYRPGNSKQFLSPIKNGEYWACGLPVLIPDGIGDDSQILKATGLGVVIEDHDHPEKYFPQLEALIKANKQQEIRQLAIKHRNPEVARKAYKKLIGRFIKKL